MLKIFTVFFTLFLSQALFSQTTVAPIQTDADITIYTAVDTVASFPGGRPAWVKFLEKNLNPAVGVENGARVGTYNVKIKFTVTKDGTLKDFVPVTKYKHGFEEEVIRVLKLSPKWIPAKKNGVNVNSTVEELQVFEISKG
jgi:protein TonB